MASKYEREHNRNKWKRQLWKLPWVLLIPIGLLLPAISARVPQYVEGWYAQKLYPKISFFLGSLSAKLPGSIAELLLYLLIALAAGLLCLFVTRLIQRRLELVRLVSFFLSLCIAVGVGLNLFYWLWGFNYTRADLSENLRLTVRARTSGELEALCRSLAQEAKSLRENLAEDENGVFTLPEEPLSYFSMLPEAYARLGARYPMFSNPSFPPKSVYASEALSYAGICGIYIPFTAEANVNMHQPPLLLLSSAAHETAHYLGVAREDEANFVAYLACLAADDPSIRYSGLMLALIHAGNALYDADKEAYTLVHAEYSAGMLRDLAHHNAYWDAYEGEIEERMDALNDSYLKHNRQSDGVKSYGRMVDLLLAYYAQ